MVERRTPEREVEGFKTYPRRVVSLSKTLYSPKVQVIHAPRKHCLRPDMTEKLLPQNKQHKQKSKHRGAMFLNF